MVTFHIILNPFVFISDCQQWCFTSLELGTYAPCALAHVCVCCVWSSPEFVVLSFCKLPSMLYCSSPAWFGEKNRVLKFLLYYSQLLCFKNFRFSKISELTYYETMDLFHIEARISYIWSCMKAGRLLWIFLFLSGFSSDDWRNK